MISVHQSKYFGRFGENACTALLERWYVLGLLKTELLGCSRKAHIKNERQPFLI